ncbi:MAG: hypothetical protein NT042_07315 [Sulfuritalea sp.]|nr:hypothetical protein [Sulfuritalea sp.]
MLPETVVILPPVPDALTISGAPRARPLREAVAVAERIEILRALEETGWVKLHAAKLLGISRAQLYEKLAILGIVSEEAGS